MPDNPYLDLARQALAGDEVPITGGVVADGTTLVVHGAEAQLVAGPQFAVRLATAKRWDDAPLTAECLAAWLADVVAGRMPRGTFITQPLTLAPAALPRRP